MDLLILGGGQFVGRYIVEACVSLRESSEAALGRGHRVSTFSRGKTNPGLFPQAEKLIGDRQAGDLEALRGRSWDAVVDVNGYLPREVRQSAELLKDRVGRYLFISTVSVYADPSNTAENGPVQKLDDPSVEEVTGATYGGLKALCEEVVQEVYGERATVVRPHLVVGPHDHTGRFTYWPWRAAQGGEMLFPGTPQTPVQFVDVRDLAAFTLHLLETGTPGIFNGARPHISMGELVEALGEATHHAFGPTWVDWLFLKAHGVRPWMDLPAWFPADDPASGLSRTPTAKSEAAGLKFRSVLETVSDTLEWAKSLPEVKTAGLSREREAELLHAWHGSKG
jgi:2'-hydroxyisoflavone reductase